MKFAVIIALILILTVGAFTWAIPNYKRKKLAEGWSGIAKKAKLNITEEQIRKELDKLPNSDIDTLVDFSQDLNDKKYLAAFKMIKKVDPIIKKTNLGDLKTYLAALI